MWWRAFFDAVYLPGQLLTYTVLGALCTLAFWETFQAGMGYLLVYVGQAGEDPAPLWRLVVAFGSANLLLSGIQAYFRTLARGAAAAFAVPGAIGVVLLRGLSWEVVALGPLFLIAVVWLLLPDPFRHMPGAMTVGCADRHTAGGAVVDGA